MSAVSDILLAWYDREGRDLPWRRTRDPYRIWLSEVILQQTRVAQGMAYYERFTERYPDIASLAAAPEDEETGEPVDVDADDEEFGLVIMKAIEENGEEILSTPDTDEELDAIYNLFMERFFEDEDDQ